MSPPTERSWRASSARSASHPDYHGPHYEQAEVAMVPTLTGLAHSYVRFEEREKLAALREFLKVLRPLLDDHGQKIADGVFAIGDKPPAGSNDPAL